MDTQNETGQERKLQDDLKDSAHRIWLAGLGALAAAEEEGSKVFSRLVERGRDIEAKGKVEAKDQFDKAKDQFEKAKVKAGSTWEELSGKVDEAVTAALHRLGVPTRDEIRNLTQKVEELNAKVDLLKPRVAPAAPAAPVTSAPAGPDVPNLPPTPKMV